MDVESQGESSVHAETDAERFESRLREALLAAKAVKEMDLARAKRVRAEQVENESIVSLLVRLGMVSERAMANAPHRCTGTEIV